MFPSDGIYKLYFLKFASVNPQRSRRKPTEFLSLYQAAPIAKMGTLLILLANILAAQISLADGNSKFWF